MLYVPAALAVFVFALSVISSVTCQPSATLPAAAPASVAGQVAPLLRNLRILHNKPSGANVTWEYTGPGPSAPYPVFFTVEYYEMVLHPCCGPRTVVHCNLTEQQWCQMEDLEDGVGYHVQVTSAQGLYSSKASSDGFFQNGNNAPAGCPLQHSVKPVNNCKIELEVLLGTSYAELLAQQSVTVIIRYSSAVSKHVESVLLWPGGRSYKLQLRHTMCNTTFNVTWEAVTNVSGVERTTGNCFNAQVNTTVSRAPVAPRLVYSGVESTRVQLRWTLAVPIKGKNSSYMVCFRDITNSASPPHATGSPSNSTPITFCPKIHNPDQTGVTLQSLAPGSVYSVNVTATNRFGRGPASNSITVITSDAEPMWSNANISCALLDSTSIILTWPEPVWNTLPSHRMRITVTASNGTAAFATVLPWASTRVVLPVPGRRSGYVYNVSVSAVSSSATAVLTGKCVLAGVLPTTDSARSTGIPSATVSRATPVAHTPATHSTSSGAVIASTAAVAKANGGLRTGWIAFIASGSGLLLALVVALMLWCRIRRKRRARMASAQVEGDPDSWIGDGGGDLLFDDWEPTSFIGENHYATDPTSPVAL